MESWAVVLLVLVLLIIIISTGYMVLRIYFPAHLAAFFSIGEEKQCLTKNEQPHTAYTAPAGTATLDVERQQQPSGARTLPVDAAGVGGSGTAASGYQRLEDSRDSAGPGEGGRSSPGSADTGSEYEAGYNLPRAASAESLASDTSVMDLQPDLSPIGQLEVGLEYDREVSELVVSVVQARDLTAVTELDFYVNIYLYPDAADMKTQTKVIKKTGNPVFKERFLYTVEPYEMGNKTVQFQVFSVDKYARHKHAGETEVRLSDLDLVRPIRLWLNLREMDEKPSDFGELMFSLSYLPTAERLTVVIVKAKNLKWARREQLSGDVLVKVHMIMNDKRSAKKKTSVKRGENQPTFNEAMIFSVPQSALSTVQLRLTVAEVTSDQGVYSIGHVIVGANTGGTELSHWQQMVSSLRKPVAMWHYLRKQK